MHLVLAFNKNTVELIKQLNAKYICTSTVQ